MKSLVNTAQIRLADRIQINRHDYPGILLMEAAAQAVVKNILTHFNSYKCCLILCGPGNNGGDGLAIARLLYLAGKQVKLLCSHEVARYQGDAKINLDILQHLPIELKIYQNLADLDTWLEELPISFLLVDALLGTGVTDTLRGNIAQLIVYFREKKLETIAVDLPSGLNASAGAIINKVIPAAMSVTFQYPKICHYVYPAAELSGEVVVEDIGLWPQVEAKLSIKRFLLDDAYVRQHTKLRKAHTHKGSYGHILIAGGSQATAGAVALCAYGAVRAGVGLCTVFTPKSVQAISWSWVPEAMCLARGGEVRTHLTIEDADAFTAALAGKSAVCIGPGMGNTTDTYEFLAAVLPHIKVPLVLDADALNICAAHPELWELVVAPCIITPHPGEMRRLFPEAKVLEQRLETAEAFAQRRDCITVLKGAGTLIALPDGYTYVNTSGNSGMATGGAGDVLSGVITALLTQGYPPDVSANLGVYLHGKAGDLVAALKGKNGLIARDLAEAVSPAWEASLQGLPSK